MHAFIPFHREFSYGLLRMKTFLFNNLILIVFIWNKKSNINTANIVHSPPISFSGLLNIFVKYEPMPNFRTLGQLLLEEKWGRKKRERGGANMPSIVDTMSCLECRRQRTHFDKTKNRMMPMGILSFHVYTHALWQDSIPTCSDL